MRIGGLRRTRRFVVALARLWVRLRRTAERLRKRPFALRGMRRSRRGFLAIRVFLMIRAIQSFPSPLLLDCVRTIEHDVVRSASANQRRFGQSDRNGIGKSKANERQCRTQGRCVENDVGLQGRQLIRTEIPVMRNECRRVGISAVDDRRQTVGQ